MFGGLRCAALIVPLAASAQIRSLPLPAVVEFDHDGRGVEGFVLYATRREDGVQRRIDVGMASKAKSGRLQIALPTLEPGTWRLELAAYNGAGESPRAKADPAEIRIDPAAKTPPSNVRPPAAAKPVPKTPPPAQKPAPPPKKKGAMGKLWSFIVGDDEP